MFYHARTEAFFSSDGEIIGRKIIHSDEAAPAIWIDAAHFAHAIAVRAFDIDQHTLLSFPPPSGTMLLPERFIGPPRPLGG